MFFSSSKLLARTNKTKIFTNQRCFIKVYTRTGDKGTSQLFNGERKPKTNQIFNALGAVDEANSMIGLARQFTDSNKYPNLRKLDNELDEIMSRLFDIGSCIATPITSSSSSKLLRTEFNDINVDALEKLIDEMDLSLPPLKNFILPSGGKCASHLHCARTVTRRAERESTVLLEEGSVESSVTKYLNRLSDYLFTAARFVSKEQGHLEIIYKKAKT